MKFISFILFTFVSLTVGLNLKNQTSINPEMVKSPGSFDNISPETTSIITPQYAKPKIEADITVTTPGLVQRNEQIGVVPVVEQKNVYNPLSDTIENVDVLTAKNIYAKTVTNELIQHNEKVIVGMEDGKVIPQKDDSKEPKKLFGK